MTSNTEKLQRELIALQVEIEEEESDEEFADDAPADPSNISTQIRLKTMHPSEKLDRDVVLRRIRHHKRMIKVRRAVDKLFSPPFSNTATTNPKDHVEPSDRWINDAFSTP